MGTFSGGTALDPTGRPIAGRVLRVLAFGTSEVLTPDTGPVVTNALGYYGRFSVADQDAVTLRAGGVEIDLVSIERQLASYSGTSEARAIEAAKVAAAEYLADEPAVVDAAALAAEQAIVDQGGIQDPVIAAVTADSASATRAALDARDAGLNDSAARFVSLITTGVRDVGLMLISDSTANENHEWFRLFVGDLAARFPTHTFTYRLWNDATSQYDAATTVATGTGSRTVHVWNASIPGATTQSWQHASRLTPAIYTPDVDLTLISLGHNEQNNLNAGSWLPRMVGLTESITARKPTTDLILIGQNPATANTWQAERIDRYRRLAARRGYGFIDVHAAFIAAGGAAALTIDGVHPNATGSRLWADTVLRAFHPRTTASPRAQGESTLSSLTPENLAINGDLADWSGDNPTDWSLALVSSTKDTTGHETGTAAVKFTTTGVGGTVRVNLKLDKVKGRQVTVAVRIKVAAGAAMTAGRIGILDGVSNDIQPAESYPTDGYRWMVHTKTIDPAATSARVAIYTGDVGNEITIDRVVATYGELPKDSRPATVSAPSGAAQDTGWVTPAGLVLDAAVTADHVRLRRQGNVVYAHVSNMVIPANSGQRVVFTVPTGYRNTAGPPGQVGSSITHLTLTGDANPWFQQRLAISGATVFWNGAVHTSTNATVPSPARIDGVMSWFTEDALAPA